MNVICTLKLYCSKIRSFAELQVLGMGHMWKGGDVSRYAGGGQKILLLRDALEEFKENANLVIMFVDW